VDRSTSAITSDRVACAANAATEICCAGFGTFACTSPGLCVGTPITCSSAASCKTGEVCCFNGASAAAASATVVRSAPASSSAALRLRVQAPQRWMQA